MIKYSKKFVQIFFFFFILKGTDRHKGLAGRVTYEEDFSQKSVSSIDHLCFLNNFPNFIKGSLTLWNCNQPYPIGRFCVYYLRDLNQDNILQVYEFIIYGIEIKEINYKNLQVSSLNRKYRNTISDSIYSLIDNIMDNTLRTCSGINEVMEKVNVTFSFTSVIYSISIFKVFDDGKLKFFSYNF